MKIILFLLSATKVVKINNPQFKLRNRFRILSGFKNLVGFGFRMQIDIPTYYSQIFFLKLEMIVMVSLFSKFSYIIGKKKTIKLEIIYYNFYF